MLKCGAVILALMILVLGIIPCADADECPETIQVSQLMEFDSHQETQHFDFCTPFCTCQCCHTHITQLDSFQLTEFSYFKNNLPAKSYLPVEGIIVGIWDPPRLIS